jgi:hypothetical protein
MSVIGGEADMPLIAAGAIDCFARADNIVRVGLNINSTDLITSKHVQARRTKYFELN